MNNFDVSQLFNPFYVEQLISFSETFDRNSIPIEKAVALNDCVDAIDKVHRASKVLGTVKKLLLFLRSNNIVPFS